MNLPRIAVDELRAKVARRDELVLVDALPPMSYAHSHLPGAINVPPMSDDRWILRRLPNKDAEIVVYCANAECEDSLVTARRLLDLGYANVAHYAGGKDEWRHAGLPLERAGVVLQTKRPAPPR